jgi:hypothetical protein
VNGRGKRAHEEVLQQRVGRGEVHVRAAREVRGLLEERGGRAVQLADVDRDLLQRPSAQTHARRCGGRTHELLRGEDGVHERDVRRARVGGDGEDEDARLGRVRGVCGGRALHALDVCARSSSVRAPGGGGRTAQGLGERAHERGRVCARVGT